MIIVQFKLLSYMILCTIIHVLLLISMQSDGLNFDLEVFNIFSLLPFETELPSRTSMSWTVDRDMH